MSSRNYSQSVRDRILHILEILELDTHAGAARALGIPRPTLVGILQRDIIGKSSARKISHATGYSYEWILEGKGPMSKRGAEIQGFVGWPSGQVTDKILNVRGVRGEAGGFVMVSKAATKTSAGGGIIPEESALPERYAFRLDWLKAHASSTQNVLLIDVEGDSMSPTLFNRDTVLIDTGPVETLREHIYVIEVGGAIQIKRLSPLPGGRVRVTSDNEAFYSYDAALDEIRIIGKVIWSCRTWV